MLIGSTPVEFDGDILLTYTRNEEPLFFKDFLGYHQNNFGSDRLNETS